MADTNKDDARFDEATRFVLGELPLDESARIEARLSTDPELAAEVRRLRQTLDLLPHAASQTPPAHLRDRVLRDAQAATRRPLAPQAHPPRRTSTWAPPLALAASIAALFFAYDAYRLRTDLGVQRELAALLSEPNVVLRYELAGVGSGSGSFGGVSLDLDDEKGAVVLRELPELPDGQVYTLWAKVGSDDVPCGSFRSNADGRVLAQFAVPVDSYTAPIKKLFVTIEPDKAAAGPTGPTVLESI